MPSSLSIRKGTSQSRDAGQAARELFAALDQPDIKFAVFYCASDFDLPTLATEMHRCFGDINLVGCTSAGEITPQGYLQGALTGFSIASADMDAVTLAIPLDPFDSASAGQSVADLLGRLGTRDGLPANATDTFAFMLIDGLSMQEEMAVSCVHQHLQGIELVGGSAADDVRFQSTHLYCDGRFHRNVALLSLVRTSLPFLTFRTQHFVKSDTRMVVTRADPVSRIVHEINGKPAAREFARLVGMQIAELTPLIFATHPVVVRIGGQYFVRSIAKVNDDDSLTFFCAIDEGLVFTVARPQDILSSTESKLREIDKELGGIEMVLGFDCVLRRLDAETRQIRHQIEDIYRRYHVVGFHTYGEQFNAMHLNQTLTGIAFGTRPS